MAAWGNHCRVRSGAPYQRQGASRNARQAALGEGKGRGTASLCAGEGELGWVRRRWAASAAGHTVGLLKALTDAVGCTPPHPLQVNLADSSAVTDDWLDALAAHHAVTLRRLDISGCANLTSTQRPLRALSQLRSLEHLFLPSEKWTQNGMLTTTQNGMLAA